jgi:hypothetical protein
MPEAPRNDQSQHHGERDPDQVDSPSQRTVSIAQHVFVIVQQHDEPSVDAASVG